MANRENSDVTAIEYLGNEVTIPPLVYEAAAKFFSAYIASNKVTNENEPAMLEKAVGQALELALATERSIALSNDNAPE